MRIEPAAPHQREAIVELSLRAWTPVFASLESVMDAAVFHEFYPDWRVSQRRAVEEVCSNGIPVWVALVNETVAGFVAVKLHTESRMGEIYMVAVDPSHQKKGIGVALTRFALQWMRDAGMAVAMVETGGDPGHAPARRIYEQAGFGLLPIARYFKKL